MKKTVIATTSLLALCLALPAAAEGTGYGTSTGAAENPATSTMPDAAANPTDPNKAANEKAGKSGKKLSRQDRNFIEEAAIGGMAEVQMGQLAAQNAQNQAVRDFANMMVNDHTTGNQRLLDLASSLGVKPPKDLDFTHRRMDKKLRNAEKKEFDEVYVETQIKAHKKMVELMEEQTKDGENAELKQLASEMLPKVREHLMMAQRLEDQVKKKQ